MQHEIRTASHAAHAILAVIWAGASWGCSSEHQLGTLSPEGVGLVTPGSETADGGDFSVSTELGPPDLRFRTTTHYDLNGQLAIGVGDLDGDGFGELATHESYETALSQAGGGYIHIRYGGPRPLDDVSAFAWAEGGARLMYPRAHQGDAEIGSITAVGDFDADGYSDFLVRADYSYPENVVGVYLVYGSPNRLERAASLSQVAVFLTGPSWEGEGCNFTDPSASNAALGDFDGDGFDDFMLTDPRCHDVSNPDADPIRPGGTYLFYGRAERIAADTPWANVAARIHAPQDLALEPLGDINADGLGDIILGSRGHNSPYWPWVSQPRGHYWLPGRTGRLSGDIDLPTVATSMVLPAMAAGDLDGDGVNEVLMYEYSASDVNYSSSTPLLDAPDAVHLFYGTAGLFDDGVDLAQTAARFEPYPGANGIPLVRAQDRDGDGDEEFVASRVLGRWGNYPRATPQLVALLSGSASRLSGAVTLPAPSNPTHLETDDGYDSFVEAAFPVGDLDGDGAADLITRSHWYPPADESGERNLFSSEYVFSQVELNIHYGTPGGILAESPR